jgi:hypothetical protein
VAHRIDLGASLESGALRLTFDGRNQEPRSVGELDGRQQAVVLSNTPRHPTKTDCPDPLHVGGGYVDPLSDGPEMMMAIYGTMSTQERRRVKMRVRSAMEEQAKVEGRYLGGRPPYGYQLVDGELQPNGYQRRARGLGVAYAEERPGPVDLVGRADARATHLRRAMGGLRRAAPRR